MREIKFRAWVERFPNGESGMLEMQPGISIHRFFKIYPEKYFQILMQYTGLKDKDGKEIYEGDIVTLDNNPETVVIKDFIIDTYDLQVSQENGAILKIIGTIYENPELLEED